MVSLASGGEGERQPDRGHSSGSVPPKTALGGLLRDWRRFRGLSQFDLAFKAGFSQRHLSFIETGRSVPSRMTLIDLAEALAVPLRERNSLLLAAGYAPVYDEGDLTLPNMRSVASALKRVLRQQEPFPAFVLDRYWNILMTNGAAPRFFGSFIDLEAHPKPRNLLRMMFDPAGMQPFIHDWDSVAKSLIGRVHREATGRVIDRRASQLLDTLSAFPGVNPAWRHPAPSGGGPVTPVGFMVRGDVLNYFSLVSTLGTPHSILAEEVRVECMFPADQATESRHRALMKMAPAG